MPKRKLLVVDDNPTNLAILDEMLSCEYRLEFAENGEDALRLANRCRPSVILLDVMMPGIDGLETCRELRKNGKLASTSIVMVSAKAMPSERVAGMEAGADEYLTKPFDEVELLEVLRRLTGRLPLEDTESQQWPEGEFLSLDR